MQNCKFESDCLDEKDCRTCTQDEKSQEKVVNPKRVVGKGAPRKRKGERLIPTFERCRKNKCGQCGKRGHNRQTCPDLRVCVKSKAQNLPAKRREVHESPDLCKSRFSFAL